MITTVSPASLLDELLEYAWLRETPPLAWVVEHVRGDASEMLQRAWSECESVSPLLNLLLMVRDPGLIWTSTQWASPDGEQPHACYAVIVDGEQHRLPFAPSSVSLVRRRWPRLSDDVVTQVLRRVGFA